MRTIETTLYEFEELTEQAKQEAIKHLRQEAFECMSEVDWNDADDTIKRAKELANITASIEQSSQGFYTRWVRYRNEYDDTPNEQLFEQYKQSIHEMHTDTWSDEMLQDLVNDFQYDHRRGYAQNVCDTLLKLCEQVYHNTLAYFDDINVVEYILMNDFEFHSNGKVYKQI